MLAFCFLEGQESRDVTILNAVGRKSATCELGVVKDITDYQEASLVCVHYRLEVVTIVREAR